MQIIVLNKVAKLVNRSRGAATFSGKNFWAKLARFARNLGKIKAKFGQK